VDVSNLHLKDKAVAEEMNNWAHDNDLIVWSASQQTKGAKDDKEARQSSVSGGTPKINTVDNLFIFKRSGEDKEDERTWCTVSKNRDGAGHEAKIPFHWDVKTQRMSNIDFGRYRDANPFLKSPMLSDERTKKRDTAPVNETVANDPIVKEMGIDTTQVSDATLTDGQKAAKAQESEDILTKLGEQFSGG
jgi:hypothetical protein